MPNDIKKQIIFDLDIRVIPQIPRIKRKNPQLEITDACETMLRCLTARRLCHSAYFCAD